MKRKVVINLFFGDVLKKLGVSLETIQHVSHGLIPIADLLDDNHIEYMDGGNYVCIDNGKKLVISDEGENKTSIQGDILEVREVINILKETK